jgi:hypothetical protein
MEEAYHGGRKITEKDGRHINARKRNIDHSVIVW